MSEYIYNTVTSYGAALIAQATAANPIVIVGALSKATAASGVQELATAAASWYDGRGGAIATVSATGNVARIVAVFRNAGSSRQAAKSIAVTARLASQTDADAVVLAAISDPASTIELPDEADTGQAVEFPINIAVNPGGTVTVTPGASASVADLDRFVSLHAPGQPTAGEAQNIYGTKTFNNGLNTTSLMCTGSIQSIVFSVIEGVYPSSDNYGDIGSADHPFANVVADTIGYSGSTIYGTVFSNGISPRTTNAYDIGSNKYRYAYVFCSNLDVLTSISCSGDISCSGTVTTNSLAPSVHLGSSIGTPSVYYLDLYAANLHGVIPTVTDESTIPVGSIVVLKDLRNIIGSDRFNPGDIFDCSTSPYQNNIIQCSLSGVVVGVGNELTTGKFKAISYLPDSEQVFLAIKFAD